MLRFGCVLCVAVLLLSSSEAQAQARSSERDSRAKPTRLEAAEKCLAQGDDECVVRTLEGWARSQAELGLLLETYRKLGRNALARQVMRTYVERFTDAPRAAAYRRMLGDTAPAPPPSAATKDAPPQTAHDRALACLTRGDNECVVRELDGHAHTAEDLGMLCETWLVLGNDSRAREVMRKYVSRFPDARRSAHYRQVLASSP